MEIWGHRGSSSIRPENTMAAFWHSLECGADGIELDAHLSKDGQIIVKHHELLERCTNGKGLVKDYTLRELKRFDAGAWFSEEFTGERIPSLEEVFDAFRDKNFFINVELKTDWFTYKGIEQKYVDLVNEYGMRDKVIVSSFNHETIQNIKQIDSSMKCGNLLRQRVLNLEKYTKHCGVQALHPIMNIITPHMLQKCDELGLLVNVWFPFSDESWFLNHRDVYKQQGFNAIITNYPQEYIN